MMDLAHVPIPPILQGQSLAPLLTKGTFSHDRAVFLEFNRYEIEHDSFGGFIPIRCIVRGDWKLVINLLSTDELYNLREDPDEMGNLIDDAWHTDVRDGLHDMLLDWMNANRDPFRGPCWERRSWRDARRYEWRGPFRPRPADGYAPPARDYETGFPAAGD
jgi:uncharacterized sulfatase